MATEEISAHQNSIPVVYSPSDAVIAELKHELSGPHDCRQKEQYELVRLGIGRIVKMRTAIEKRRVELKADALAYGRKVDSEAKRLTGLLLAIEDPLRQARQIVDDEKERIKREAEEKERRQKEEALRAELAAEEAEREKAREIEREKMRQEVARLAEARRKFEAEQAEARKEMERLRVEREAHEREQRESQEKIEAEQRRLAAERERFERLEFERQTREQAESRATEQAKMMALALEEKRKKEADETAARQREIDSQKPDIEKIHALGDALAKLDIFPEMKTLKGRRFIASVKADFAAIHAKCVNTTVL